MKFKFIILIWIILVNLYFITRLANLKIIPIFTDEAIYVYWAQVALHDPANRFISLEDGKQPLFIWLAAVSQKFISDPLIASRLVSVFAGFGSLIAIYFLCKSLFEGLSANRREKIAMFSAFLYIALPFTLLYDRLALFDSLLTMFGILAIFFSLKLVKDLKLETALLCGFVIGAAMITKSLGSFFLYFLPFSLAFFNFKIQSFKVRFFKWLALAAVTFFLAQIIYNSLRLSPLFYIIARKNLEFIRSFSEVVTDPFAHFSSNMATIISWIIAYLGWPLFIIFVAGLFYGLFKRNLAVIYLSVLIFGPFLTEALFNKVLYPRFVLFYFPYVIILISYIMILALSNSQKLKKYLMIILILSLFSPISNSFRLLTNPPTAKIAQSDASQYFNDWPAGYGIAEVTSLLKEESKKEKVYVGTEGTFGLLPYALQIYFFGNDNLQITGFWPVNAANLPQQILDQANQGKTYFVFNENQKDITNAHLRLIAKYQKGHGQSFMRLYEVIP